MKISSKISFHMDICKQMIVSGIQDKMEIKQIIIILMIILVSDFAYAEAAPEGNQNGSEYCNNPSSWPKGQEEKIKSRCKQIKLMEQQYRDTQTRNENWLGENGKSQAMKDIFMAYKRIPETSEQEGDIKWVFKLGPDEDDSSECMEYLFSQEGVVKGSRVTQCEPIN